MSVLCCNCNSVCNKCQSVGTFGMVVFVLVLLAMCIMRKRT